MMVMTTQPPFTHYTPVLVSFAVKVKRCPAAPTATPPGGNADLGFGLGARVETPGGAARAPEVTRAFLTSFPPLLLQLLLSLSFELSEPTVQNVAGGVALAEAGLDTRAGAAPVLLVAAILVASPIVVPVLLVVAVLLAAVLVPILVAAILVASSIVVPVLVATPILVAAPIVVPVLVAVLAPVLVAVLAPVLPAASAASASSRSNALLAATPLARAVLAAAAGLAGSSDSSDDPHILTSPAGQGALQPVDR